MARPRKGLSARLPVNLTFHQGSGQYRYIRPDTKRTVYLGKDRKKAVEAAHKANGLLMPSTDLLSKIVRTEHKLSELCELFQRDWLPSYDWKPKTATLNGQRLARIRGDLGGRVVESLTTRDCAEYLHAVTDSVRARQQYRSALIRLLQVAVQEGWIDHNPAKETAVPKAKRQRDRLELEDFMELRERASPWLRNAMDIALHTLLRRQDIVSLRFTDIRDGALYVVPRKTESSTGERIRMEITPVLADVLARCHDDIASPFVVHRLPEKARPSDQRAKERDHHTQVLPEQLTRAFSRLVEESQHFGPKPPTFHEIRSLGGDLYRQAGWSLAEVQRLMGHASPQMTKEYLRGHEAPWTDVKAGLQLTRCPDGVAVSSQLAAGALRA